ncbi:hypothetical protein NBRC116595_20000 [Aliiglaciecola sp. NS0011-25]
MNAINKVPIQAANAVTVIKPATGIPEADKMLGLTTNTYDIAANVVRPAMHSVLKFVPCCDRLKKRSKNVFIG